MASVMVVSSTLPTLADAPFVPKVTFPSGQTTLADRNIDILALVPGMTSREVRAALLALPNPETLVEKETNFSVASRGVRVQTAEFMETMSSGMNDDQISVSFTGPASDNQAFMVERDARYPEVLSAPTVDAIIEALTSKYGAPSYNTRDLIQVNTAELVWVFKDGAQLPCQGLGSYGNGERCPFQTSGRFYDPGQFGDLAAEILPFDYLIFAKVDTQNADRTKTAGFTVTVSDLLRRKQAASADMKAMLQELERVHAEASKPTSAPSM